MGHTLLIKNMVCARCKSTIVDLLKRYNFDIESIELGKVVVKQELKNNYDAIKTGLKDLGFELIEEESKVLIEKVKLVVIQCISENNVDHIISKITKEIGKNDSAISKLFSKSEGITLEKYIINLKIEKVKEYIQLNQLNFSEIAYNLNYNTSSHLAKQFKSVTGMSMSEYKKIQNWDRKELDQIV
ncbi:MULTISPECIES: helix-turn-helix domain-containing protein [Winogradskyella]|uniref:helix-turn-helix domain-containing protein n=1 Tax=Winogradskyella TaxID=286104 RepID=UPI0015CCF181|nr:MULTISPECIES: helix-turn-helix transcriptional regulator [Winogradskyella]QXP79060.1 helix-turn-helix transcriptional regulator [Winogradskyella sp. HaHa_3_26]